MFRGPRWRRTLKWGTCTLCRFPLYLHLRSDYTGHFPTTHKCGLGNPVGMTAAGNLFCTDLSRSVSLLLRNRNNGRKRSQKVIGGRRRCSFFGFSICAFLYDFNIDNGIVLRYMIQKREEAASSCLQFTQCGLLGQGFTSCLSCPQLSQADFLYRPEE